MAIAFVQQASTYSTNNLSLTGVGAGNLLVAFVSAADAVGIGLISGGGTWVSGGTYSSAGVCYLRWFYCLSATGGNTTVANSFAGTDGGWGLIEFSGGTFSYSQITGLTDNTTNPSTASLTVVVGELCVGGLADESPGGDPSAWGGFTNPASQPAHYHGTASKVATTTSQAFGVTRSGVSGTVITMITFTATSGGGGTAVPVFIHHLKQQGIG